MAVAGAEFELLDALEVRGGVGVQPGAVQVPLAMLLTDDPAQEKRAATTTGDYGGAIHATADFLSVCSGRSLFGMLGVPLRYGACRQVGMAVDFGGSCTGADC